MDSISDSDSEDAGSIPAGTTIVYVYCLRNKINEEIYVGISAKVALRLKQHNSGQNRYTKAFMPWSVFHTEQFTSYGEARRREKYLKSAAGKRFLRSLDAGSLPA